MQSRWALSGIQMWGKKSHFCQSLIYMLSLSQLICRWYIYLIREKRMYRGFQNFWWTRSSECNDFTRPVCKTGSRRRRVWVVLFPTNHHLLALLGSTQRSSHHALDNRYRCHSHLLLNRRRLYLGMYLLITSTRDTLLILCATLIFFAGTGVSSYNC